MNLRSDAPQARSVLDFWFQDGLETGWPSQNPDDLWFGGGPELDRTIDQRFGELVRAAVVGGLENWETEPLDRLALVLLLDQFTRNVFRGRAQAFSGDARAQALATDALARGWDKKLPLAGRVFLYMPLTHAENMVHQDECVRHMQALVAEAESRLTQNLQDFLRSAQQHRGIIARFGRFPHRNAVLGRASSLSEVEFLTDGPRFGQ